MENFIFLCSVTIAAPKNFPNLTKKTPVFFALLDMNSDINVSLCISRNSLKVQPKPEKVQPSKRLMHVQFKFCVQGVAIPNCS